MSLLDYLLGGSNDSSGGLVNWNTPRPEAVGPNIPALAFNYQQPAQQNALQKIGSALQQFSQGFNQVDNRALDHLSKLAGAAPQYYAGQYASALANQADPIAQRLNEAKIQALTNPNADPSKAIEMAIQQSKLQQEQQKLQQGNLERQILAGGSLSDYAQPSGGMNAPLNQRNNNPGNLKDPNTGAFRNFSSPEEGAAANLADLQYKISGDSPAMKAKFGDKYTPTLSNLIATWAPASDNNDPAAYAKFVSQKTGIPVNQPLKVEDAKTILPAIAQFEGGQNYNAQSALANYTAPPQTQTNAVQTPESSALAKLGQLAAVNPEKYGLAYTNAQLAAEKEKQKNEDTVITPDNANLHGDDFLNTLPDGDVKNKAKALIEGRAPFPTVNSRTPSNVKKALEAAQQADPTLSAATYPMRAKAAKDFASGGQEAKNINALNTALNHLNTLADAAEGLNNSGFTTGNAATNYVQSKVDDKFNARLKKYETAKDAVASEVAKVYKGAGALSVEEQKQWQSLLSPDLGPEAQKAAISQTAELLKGKIDALNKQYSDAFGGVEKDFLSDKAKKVFGKLGIPLDDSGSGKTITLDEFLSK